MDDDPSVFVIFGTIFLYVSLGFCVGWISWTWQTRKHGKENSRSQPKGLVQFIKSIFTKNEKPTSSLICIEDYKNYAKEELDSHAWNFFNDGAMSMYTIQENITAHSRYQLMPKSFVDVSDFDAKATILGQTIDMPIGIAPVSHLCWAHSQGDIGAARAAKNCGTIFISSSHASTSLEDLAISAPDGIKWQQVYLFGLRDITLDIVKRAEEHGYSAIVVTIDKPHLQIHYNAKRGNAEIPKKFTKYPNFKNFSEEVEQNLFNNAQTWEELKWLKGQTKLPIVLKGVINEVDVPLAAKAGVKGIIVSNHGGRVLDSVPATIDVLEEIVRAAQNTKMEIYVDGGITSGMDVLKVIARGAKMVFIGKPMVWGLASNGQQGVESVLEILNSELINTAKLCGAANMKSIDKTLIQYVGRG